MPDARGWVRILAVYLFGKALAIAAMLSGLRLAFWPLHDWNYHMFTDRDAGMWLAFINWDGQHFLKLAFIGYPIPADATTVFFPLFPSIIHLLMEFGHLHPITAGLIVTAVFSLLALVMLDKLLPAEERAPSSLWLLACYPTAFYLSAVYAEGLFLTAFFGLLWALRDPRRAPWALFFAAALPLARGQGIWLAAPLAAAWLALLLPRPAAALRLSLPFSRASLTSASAGYALGTACYFVIMAATYGNPFAGFEAQQMQGSHHSIANLFDIPRFINLMLSDSDHFLYPTRSRFDRIMIVLSFLALAYGVARGERDPFLLTAWACFAILPATMGEFGGYSRYSFLAWGCFVVSVGPKLGSLAKAAIIVPAFCMQAMLAYYHGANRWVA